MKTESKQLSNLLKAHLVLCNPFNQLNTWNLGVLHNYIDNPEFNVTVGVEFHRLVVQKHIRWFYMLYSVLCYRRNN